MTNSPNTSPEQEAAVAKLLTKLNRSGAIDRIRKAVEARMTGDTRRMDKLQTDITNYLNDKAPADSPENLNPKSLVTLAKQQVLTPELEHDIRQDIEAAMAQLQMKALFDAEMKKLSQAAPQKKQEDIDQVRARERKAFLANIIKPMNRPNQPRPCERKLVRHPTPTRTATPRAAPSDRGSGTAGGNARIARNTPREAEQVTGATLLPSSSKRPRPSSTTRTHPGRIPPSAAKPPAGPHKTELKRIAQTIAAHEKVFAPRSEGRVNGAARQSLGNRGSELECETEQTRKAEPEGKKPGDGLTGGFSMSGGSGKGKKRDPGTGKASRDDEPCEAVSATVEDRPCPGTSDVPVVAGALLPETSPRKEAGIPPRAGAEQKATDAPVDLVVAAERPAHAVGSTADGRNGTSIQPIVAEFALLKEEDEETSKTDARRTEGETMEAELPLSSWRRPASRNWWVFGDERSATSGLSGGKLEINCPVEVDKPNIRRGESGTKDAASPAVSNPSYDEGEEYGDAKSDSSREYSPRLKPPSQRMRDEAKDVSHRKSRNRGGWKYENYSTTGRGERKRGRRALETAKKLARKPLSRARRRRKPSDKNSRPASDVKDSKRLALRPRDAKNRSEFLSEPTGDRDSIANKKDGFVALAGTKPNGTRKEQREARDMDVPSISKRYERSNGDGSHRSKKRPRGSPSDAEVYSSYDFVDQQRVLRALRELAKEQHAYPFLLPVDPSDEGCENYYNEISNPMNVFTITERLESSTPEHGYYNSVEDVLRDIDLIWSNCRDFNGSYDPVVKDAEKCVNSLDILFEEEGLQRGVGGRPKRRRSHVKPVKCDRQEGEQSYGMSTEGKSWVEAPNSAKEMSARQAEMAKENKENDGRLVGQDVIVFTREGSKKVWLPVDVMDHDPDSCTYTIRMRRSGEIMQNVRFGPFTPFTIVRIVGKPL